MITINISQKIAIWMIIILISEGMIVKSAIFLGNDPTVAHYAISAALGTVIFLICIINKYLRYIINWQSIIFLFCVLWSLFSSVRTEYSPNLIATITFGAMFLFFFSSIPVLINSVRQSSVRILYFPFLAMAVISLILYLTEISSVFDPDSGRFLGSYISVANAGIGFSFFTIFSAYFALTLQERGKKIFYAFMVLIGLYLCFLTKTRSVALETIAFIALLYYGYRISNLKERRSFLVPALVIFGVSALISVVVVGGVDWSDTASDYRISEGRFQDSRTGNWAFGVERALNAPLFGEGMLTKQTQGGTRSLDLATGDNYDSTYDPHSLVLSLSVQAGLPFAIGIMILILGTLLQYLMIFGIKKALCSPEFVICAVHTLVMIPSGGDLTSFGNFSDRIYWILLGAVALQSNLEKRKRTAYRPPIAQRAVSRPLVI